MLKVSINKLEDIRIELKVINKDTATILSIMIRNILMNRLLFRKMRKAIFFIFMSGTELLSVTAWRRPGYAFEHFAKIAVIRIADHSADVRNGDQAVFQKVHGLLDPHPVEVFAEPFFMVGAEIRRQVRRIEMKMAGDFRQTERLRIMLFNIRQDFIDVVGLLT